MRSQPTSLITRSHPWVRDWNSSPTITSTPIIKSWNYLNLASSVELWCKGQGAKDHLTKNLVRGVKRAKHSGRKLTLNYVVSYGNLSNSKLRSLFHPFQTCYFIWERLALFLRMVTVGLSIHWYTTSKYVVPLLKYYNLHLEHLFVVPMNSLKRQKYLLFELLIYVHQK